MTLAFSTHWKKDMPGHLVGKPTYFVEKIWSELVSNINIDLGISDYASYLKKYEYAFNTDFGYDKFYINPKKHTIRKDSNNRWKEGNNIHFVINNRTKNRFQFAPIIPCKSTQRIDIYQVVNVYTPYSYKTKNNKVFQISIDGNCLTYDKINRLAKNDGFDSVDDFFSYFNTDFSGKIIHWTDLKY